MNHDKPGAVISRRLVVLMIHKQSYQLVQTYDLEFAAATVHSYLVGKYR